VPRLLFVTASAAERDAVIDGRSAAHGEVSGTELLRVSTPAGLMDVLCCGVGPIAAAVETAAVASHYDLVLSVGIAGGFPGVDIGSVVVASSVVHADLGADSDNGFASMADLGWGPVRWELDPAVVSLVAGRTSARTGAVLTVSTVTGTADHAAALAAAWPDAVAEGMEGVGVYRAAARARVPFAEIRAISNPVGPRDRDAWRIGDALLALTAAINSLVASPLHMKVSA
jgi:futalosine hydrolase